MARILNTTPRSQVTTVDALRKFVIGQDHALEQIAEMLTIHNAGLSTDDRPIASIFGAGPTGVGKTETFKGLAHFLHGDKKKLIRVDCGEFQHAHEISKLIGAPPGYLGHPDQKVEGTKPRLSSESLKSVTSDNSNISIILFDEPEKADDALFNLVLAMLNDGALTLGTNETVSFKNCIIGFASNVGMRDISQGVIGFTNMNTSMEPDKEVLAGLKRKFSPEFRNRLDLVITYKYLGPEEIRKIIMTELTQICRKLHRKIRMTKSGADFLMKHGYSKEYGARYMSRAMRKYITLPIAHAIDNQDLSPFEDITVSYEKGNALKMEANQTRAAGV